MKKSKWDERFDALILKSRFSQDVIEFKLYIEFVANFFLKRKILNPLVVEIGTRRNYQKYFYKELLMADHIGIDISDRFDTPDILGDSHDRGTFKSLIFKIRKRNVDLLFIDGNHTFDSVRDDYRMYSPLVDRGIVAFHDVECDRGGDMGVPLFWSNLIQTDHQYPYVTIFNWREKDHMGIGLQVRD